MIWRRSYMTKGTANKVHSIARIAPAMSKMFEAMPGEYGEITAATR